MKTIINKEKINASDNGTSIKDVLKELKGNGRALYIN